MPIDEIIETSEAPQAIGPYSQAVKAGNVLYASGQIGLDPVTGELVGPGIEEQARQVLDNLTAVLRAAGASLGDVVKTTVYVTDLSDFSRVNQIYSGYFSAHPPARATVQVAALPKGARVEIDAIAQIQGLR